ncbi:ATP-binding mismatch repair protein, partial [Bonamia ostreae]
PIKLNFTEEEKNLIIENRIKFIKKKVCFGFENKKPVSVTTIPLYKNLNFDYFDIKDMCRVLKDGYFTDDFQFKSVKLAIATKACRSAIMVGKALSRKEMLQIVRNLVHLENPWSCPHGRPTICHLKEINSLLDKNKLN